MPPKCGATPKDAEQDPLFRALLKPGFGRVFFCSVRKLEHCIQHPLRAALIFLEAAAARQHPVVATYQHGKWLPNQLTADRAPTVVPEGAAAPTNEVFAGGHRGKYLRRNFNPFASFR